VTRLLLAIVVLCLAAKASAEECIVKTETAKDKSYYFDVCVGRIDDIVKTNVDGYVMINYILQYKGQRLTVSDPLARSDHAVGDRLCFFVGKIDHPADAQSQGWKTLFANVYEGKPGTKDCPP